MWKTTRVQWKVIYRTCIVHDHGGPKILDALAKTHDSVISICRYHKQPVHAVGRFAREKRLVDQFWSLKVININQKEAKFVREAFCLEKQHIAVDNCCGGHHMMYGSSHALMGPHCRESSR